MTQSDWIAVASTVIETTATFAAVRYALFLQARSLQPNSRRDNQKLKSILVKVGLIIQERPWLILVIGFTGNAFFLVADLRKHTPVTRWTIAKLSLDVSGFLFTWVIYLIVSMLHVLKSTTEIQLRMNKSIEGIIDAISLEAVTADPQERPPR